MILSDFDLMNLIRSKRLSIEPFSPDIVRENGIDFRLDSEIGRHIDKGPDFIMDPHSEESIHGAYSLKKCDDVMVVNGKEQVLLTTIETIELPDDIVGMVELRSTWARHGLSMPPTIIDAGFKGTVTLEVINNAPYKIALRPHVRFAHVIFVKTSSRVEKSYSGKYMGQKGIKLPKVMELPEPVVKKA
jgi:dCTP deaminase